MKNKATVISVNKNYAVVEVSRLSACDGCHKSTSEQGCSVCSLMGGNRSMTARAENSLGAKPGDVVMIETASTRVLWYVALVFLLPLIMALIGYLIATAFTAEPIWQALSALGALAGSFVAVFMYSSAVQKRRIDIVITQILSTDLETDRFN